MSAPYPAQHEAVPSDLAPAEVVATWPVGTFLENIAALPGGDLVLSVHSERQLLRCTSRGEHRPLATLPLPTMGLVVDGERVFVVAGEPGTAPGVLFEVGLDGSVQERLTLPDNVFLNGFTPGHAGRAYAVDSVRGEVIALDLQRFTARVALADERLAKCSELPMVPGANGLKADDTSLWITNTDRATVLRADLGGDGSLGPLRVVAEHLRGDDLALDVDGAAYITTHIENALVRLRPTVRGTSSPGRTRAWPAAPRAPSAPRRTSAPACSWSPRAASSSRTRACRSRRSSSASRSVCAGGRSRSCNSRDRSGRDTGVVPAAVVSRPARPGSAGQGTPAPSHATLATITRMARRPRPMLPSLVAHTASPMPRASPSRAVPSFSSTCASVHSLRKERWTGGPDTPAPRTVRGMGGGR